MSVVLVLLVYIVDIFLPVLNVYVVLVLLVYIVDIFLSVLNVYVVPRSTRTTYTFKTGYTMTTI
jgi:hypothetical protein